MTDLNENVWYACYGSNILEERFLCYIRGGQPRGSKTLYQGCTNKALPSDNEDLYICSELYFAQNSPNWDNCGVAFVRTTFEPQISTMAKMYLVTKGQLIDIARQETKSNAGLTIDFDKTIKNESLVFKKRSWYGNILYLGHQRDYPIFTLTNENDLQPFTKPSKLYLKTIIEGIKEAHNFDSKTIFEYVAIKKGVNGNYTDNELWEIIEE